MQIFWLVGGNWFFIFFQQTNVDADPVTESLSRWYWHMIPQGPKSTLRFKGKYILKKPSGISNMGKVLKWVLYNHKKEKKTNKESTKSRDHAISALWRSHENVLCFREGGSKNLSSNYTTHCRHLHKDLLLFSSLPQDVPLQCRQEQSLQCQRNLRRFAWIQAIRRHKRLRYSCQNWEQAVDQASWCLTNCTILPLRSSFHSLVPCFRALQSDRQLKGLCKRGISIAPSWEGSRNFEQLLPVE